MACDICGKTGVPLQQLITQYQTDKISDLCSECMNETNEALGKIRSMTQKLNYTFVQRFMLVLKEKFSDGKNKC